MQKIPFYDSFYNWFKISQQTVQLCKNSKEICEYMGHKFPIQIIITSAQGIKSQLSMYRTRSSVSLQSDFSIAQDYSPSCEKSDRLLVYLRTGFEVHV